MVDPANQHGSLSAGMAGLDGYLTASPDGWYRNEATVLRRTAAVAEGIANGTKALAAVTDSSAPPAVRDTVVVGSKSRDEQIAALRDQLAQSKAELAKVSAELDRIKKRLANPSNYLSLSRRETNPGPARSVRSGLCARLNSPWWKDRDRARAWSRRLRAL